MNERPILAGVVGWPIEHSLSPLIHTIWAARAKIDGYYIPIAVPPDYDDFARAMDSLRTVGFAGVNVTLPHKENALRYAVTKNDAAKKAGAANMLTFTKDGAVAENSDISGFENALKTALDFDDRNKKTALVLGAGGASRGIALALRNLGFSDITITNRTREKAENIAELFALSVSDWGRRNEAAAAASVVVNTTSLGMTGQPPLELDIAELRSGAIVADIVYTPLETGLLKQAAARGLKTVDGLAMLMHQAAPGFNAWFSGGAQVDEALRAELVTELKRRGQR